MKLTVTLVPFAVLCSTLFFAGTGVAQPSTPPSECPTSITSIADCPDTGCGKDADIELNKAKNRIDVPTGSELKHKTMGNMRAIVQPTRWNTGQNRASIRTAGKEGTPIELMGFLLRVKPGSAESCNCDLTRRVTQIFIWF